MRIIVTEYAIRASGRVETTKVVEAPTAREAILAIVGKRRWASFTARDERHGHGQAWIDNAYLQFDAAGRFGIYAEREGLQEARG